MDAQTTTSFTWTAAETVVAVLGSSGFVGGLISGANLLNNLLTARRTKKEKKEKQQLDNSIEIKRLTSEADGHAKDSLTDALWKLIEEKDKENLGLKEELEVCEEKATLQRPTLLKIYKNLRDMRKEAESLNIMVMSEEDTNVFMRRFNRMIELLNDTEQMLP